MNSKSFITESISSFLSRGGVINHVPAKHTRKRKPVTVYTRDQIIGLRYL